MSETLPTPGQLNWAGPLNTVLGDLDTRMTSAEGSITALPGTFVPQLPSTGSYTYSGGLVQTDPDGNSYAYNVDGTVHTITKGGVTRTYTYNTDGTIASVA